MANFLVDKSVINGSEAVISGEEAKHIARVLRMEKGDSLTLCDGEGFFYDGVISSVGEKEVRADISSSYPAPTEPKLKITLFQGIPKNPKLETIVQKATEIGAVKIVPMNTSRIVSKLEKDSKLERLRKIACEASKQSKRGIVPLVNEAVSFEKALSIASQSDLAIIPYEEERTMGLRELFNSRTNITSLAIMIGPEGGFEESEIDLARRFGVVPVTLGKRILRTETAGLAVMSAAMCFYGEME